MSEMPTLYVLAHNDLKVPMPDRGFRLFGIAGETVDPADPYYGPMIAAGDLVPALKPKARPATKKED